MRVLALGLAFLIAAPVGAAKISIETKHVEGFDFSKLKTYAWMELPPKPETDPLAEGSPMDRTIRAAVEKGLDAKGYVRTDDGAADFLVVCHGSVADRLSVDGLTYKVAPRVRYSGPEGYVGSRSHQEGLLIVDVVDRASNEAVWSGSAVVLFSGPSTGDAKLQGKAEKAIKKLLKKFPSKKK